ncbi:hypothetical protein BC830DRAFT_1133179 [Chytriomyces sp. MP71]|nr:hypothetical protein BC830DRAFT_1157068 [Chytriomyces sp. MP71]KAI8613221.1 hypothetical protein BC830DRAFT_1133179 [Chytriomyces sp. MP71]
MSYTDKITAAATSAATTVAAAVEPYVPQTVKDTVVTPALTVASGVKDDVLANGLVNTGLSYATQAKDYALGQASQAKDYALEQAEGYRAYTIATAKWAIGQTTTTITAFTPSPILDLMKETVAGAQAVRQDPVATLRPYVPAFVVHTSERTYEIVKENVEHTQESLNATTGFVVSRVNGVVEQVTSIPRVNSVIEKLNTLAAPVLEKLHLNGKSEVPAVEAEATVNAAAPAAQI